MNLTLDEKVARLPSWARQYIRELKIRAEPNLDEIVRLRREVENKSETIHRQQDRIDAMLDMFQCAAKGGNEIAAAVLKIAQEYIILPDPLA